MRATPIVYRCRKCGKRRESMNWTEFCEECNEQMLMTASAWIRM